MTISPLTRKLMGKFGPMIGFSPIRDAVVAGPVVTHSGANAKAEVAIVIAERDRMLAEAKRLENIAAGLTMAIKILEEP